MIDHHISPLRRKILLGAAGALASQLTVPAWAKTQPPGLADEFWIRPRTISLIHTSRERLISTYWSDGELIRSAYEEVSWFMRDRVAQKGVYMNPVLLDIVYGVGGWLSHFGLRQPITITSAYRTPERNRRIEGAALNSEHPKGNALDVVIPGVSPKQVSAFGRWLGGGGVGWYPHRGFTHLDNGRLRSWRG